MIQDRPAGTARRLRVLISDTNRDAHGARMAMAFADLGCEVGAICPRHGHPIATLDFLCSIYSYNGFDPRRPLCSAIRAFQPDLIVPACESSVGYLYRLHAEAVRNGDRDIAKGIERSLGNSTSFPVGQNRYEFLRIAREEGILVPKTIQLAGKHDLIHLDGKSRKWALKSDGSWGGEGVWRIENRAEALRCMAIAKRSLRWTLKQLDLGRDWGFIVDEWKQPPPRLILQEWIEGRPANCAMACWKGEILAGNCVEVLESNGARGHATLVEVVEGAPMFEAARRIARRLHLSGFFGLDFLIENSTGCHYLLELNPRCTALSALRLGDGHDLPAALQERILGVARNAAPPVTDYRRIAYFPRPSAYLDYPGEMSRDCYYDVPQGQPQLTARLLVTWPKFSLLRTTKRMVRRVIKKESKHHIQVWMTSHPS